MATSAASLDIFIPTCLADKAQVDFLLRSLDTFLDSSIVSTLNIAIIDVDHAFDKLSDLDTLKFKTVTNFFRKEELGLSGQYSNGWLLQQVAKLLFARKSTTDFYMVLDSKNFALRPVYLQDLIVEGKAAWKLNTAATHPKWWRGAAWALRHPKFDRSPSRRVLAASTPVLLHRRTVLALLEWLERKWGVTIEDFLLKPRLIRHRLMRPTEFTMYYAFLDREKLLNHYHFESERLIDGSVQLWGNQTPTEQSTRFAQILSGNTKGFMTGIHRPAWKTLTQQQRNDLYRYISRVPEGNNIN